MVIYWASSDWVVVQSETPSKTKFLDQVDSIIHEFVPKIQFQKSIGNVNRYYFFFFGQKIDITFKSTLLIRIILSQTSAAQSNGPFSGFGLLDHGRPVFDSVAF